MPPSKCQTFRVFQQSRPVAAGCEQRDDLIATLAGQSVNSGVDSAQRGCLLSTTSLGAGGRRRRIRPQREKVFRAIDAKRIRTWCGIGLLVALFVMFMLAAERIPPLSPTSDAQHLTQHWVDHKLRIRWGVA
jgi:hypothetical protein